MKKEKKEINVLTVLFISHKSDVKTLLNWILNQCRAAFINMTLSFMSSHGIRSNHLNDYGFYYFNLSKCFFSLETIVSKAL